MKTKLSLFILLLAVFTTYNTQAQILYTTSSNGGAPDLTRNSQTVTDWLHYDSDNYTEIGNPNGAYTIGTYVKLTSTLLNPHIGRQIEELKFFIGDKTKINGDLEIRFYTDLSSTPVYTQTVATSTLTSEEWNTVVLTTPYQISNGNDLYVGYYADMQPGYFSGIDDGSNFVTDVNYLVFNGTQYELGAAGLPYNWNIRAGVGGAIAANDCGISALALDDIFVAGSQQISGTLTNYGSTTLTQVDVNYQIDSGATVTETLNGLNLATGDSHTFTFSTPWNATSGNHTVKVFTSNFNGNGNDNVLANDSMEKIVFVVNEIFPRNVVYEEGTGTWCGWCVRGIAGLKDMAHYHNDGSWIGIAVHHGTPSTADPMQTTDGYSDFIVSKVSGFPNGVINRHASEVDPGYQTLEDAYNTELAKIPLAKVDITNVSWTTNRHMNIEVEAKFALDLNNADYKLSLIIVENNVTGTTSGYDQHNYYSSSANNIDLTDWEGINYKNLPDPIPAAQMVYNHVGRAIVGDIDGVNGSIPANITYNSPYSYTFSYNLPTYINENNVELVAIIIDGNTGEIVNGKQVAFDSAAGVSNLLNDINIKMYPNPANNIINISGAKDVHIEILGITGNSIFEKDLKNDLETISINKLPRGMYLIKFTKNNKSGVKKLMIF